MAKHQHRPRPLVGPNEQMLTNGKFQTGGDSFFREHPKQVEKLLHM